MGDQVLRFLGVVFLVCVFWVSVAKMFKRHTTKERQFRHWLDDSHE